MKNDSGFLIIISNICHGQFWKKEVFLRHPVLDCTIHKVCSNFGFILITQSRQLGNRRLLGPVLIPAQKTDVQTKTTHCNVDNFNEQSYASSALQSRSEADSNLEAEMLQKD